MNVTRGQILSRGLRNRCPNCGEATLFVPGALLKVNPACPACGLRFDRGEGFFLGAFIVNYTATVFLFVLPVVALGVARGLATAAIAAVAGAGALFIPLLLYRSSWSWWLMSYFYFLPEKLPNNRTGQAPEDEE